MGLCHGEFFDLYDVAYQLGIPIHEAGKVMIYLRTLRHVEKQGEWPLDGSLSRYWPFIQNR